MTMFMLESQIAPWGQKSISLLSLTVVWRVKSLGWIRLFGLAPAAHTEQQRRGRERQGHDRCWSDPKHEEKLIIFLYMLLYLICIKACVLMNIAAQWPAAYTYTAEYLQPEACLAVYTNNKKRCKIKKIHLKYTANPTTLTNHHKKSTAEWWVVCQPWWIPSLHKHLVLMVIQCQTLDYSVMLWASHCHSSCVGSSEEGSGMSEWQQGKIARLHYILCKKKKKKRSCTANSSSAQGYMCGCGQSFGEI